MVNRVSGTGRSWLIEGINDYGGGDIWRVVVALEFASDGRMLSDTAK